MKKRSKPRVSGGPLRRRAERRLEKMPAKAAARTHADAQRLLHELEVHQVELQVQNEELRAARAEVEAALERYTELFDFAPIGYAVLRVNGTIQEINHAGARLLGRERSRLLRGHFELLVAPGDRPVWQAILHDTVHLDARYSDELTLSSGGGAPLKVHLTATLLARSQQKILLAFEDITEQKAREEKLAHTEQALREAGRRKDEFLAMLSHELRNPLAPITNSLFALDKEEPGSAVAKRARVTLKRQIGHLTTIIDDLLDFNRITRGKIRLKCSRVELRELLARALEDHRKFFDAAGIELRGDLQPGRFWVDADPTRLVQIVNNLFSNAEKFTPRGGRVQLGLSREGAWALIRVTDTGAGIAPEQVPLMFEPFRQGPQTIDRQKGGLGLGLAMVKGLVDAHQGSVAIESAGIGMGTEVRIRLELLPDAAAAATEPASPRIPSRRVLVIDDNRDAADTLADVLGYADHQVQVAYDGPSGLEAARQFRPEVVICDLGMPGMDGYAVARAFRADAELSKTILVALTGYAQPEDVKRAVQAGFDRHVAKPANLKRLDAVLAGASP